MTEIPKIDKAAILLLSVSRDAMEGVLKKLDEKQIQRLQKLMDYYRIAPDLHELIEEVREEFGEMAGSEIDLDLDFLMNSNPEAAGGSDITGSGSGGSGGGGSSSGSRRRPIGSGEDRRQAFQVALSEVEGADPVPAVSNAADMELGEDPFTELQELELGALIAGLRREQPITAAIVLNHLPAAKAAEALRKMGAEQRHEVFIHMANGLPESSDLNRRIVRSVVEVCSKVGQQPSELSPDEQYRLLAEVLQAVDPNERETMIHALQSHNADQASQLDNYLFEFTDLFRMDDRSLQRLLSTANMKSLATALHGADEELLAWVKQNLSDRVRQGLQEEMEFQGSVANSRVEEARSEITDMIRDAEKEGHVRWRS